MAGDCFFRPPLLHRPGKEKLGSEELSPKKKRVGEGQRVVKQSCARPEKKDDDE